MISAAQWRAYNEAVAKITDAAKTATANQLADWLAGHKGATVAEAREEAQRILAANAETYSQAATALAADWYDAQGRAAGAKLDRAVTSVTVDRDSLSKTVRYQAQKLIDGDVDGFCDAVGEWAENEAKRALNATIMANAKRDRRKGVMFARVTSGRNTCGFCLMLASRGAVYHTRQSAGELGQYHRHCSCKIVPSYSGNRYEILVEGHDPRDMQKLWRACEEIDAADSLSGKQREVAKGYMADGICANAQDAIARVTDEPIAASPVFLNSSSELYRRMKRVEPLDGYYDVMGHSDGRSLVYGDLNDNENEPGTAFTMKELKAAILADESYKGGPIRVVACDAGGTADGLAQKLADEMGVAVYAPTTSVYVEKDGTLALLRDDEEYAKFVIGELEETGIWRLFKPRGAQ